MFVYLGFIYNIKRSGEDILPRYKARLVYKNHPFVNSSTWDQVFALVVDKATLQIFFTISGREKLFIRQVDVVTAYLNAAMDEEVFIKLLNICGDDSSQVRQFFKALYGNPKAGQLWNNKFVGFMKNEGFILKICTRQVFLLSAQQIGVSGIICG